MEFVLVTDKEIFHNLKHDWDQLVMRSNHLSYFATWSWLYTWWDIYQSQGMSLQIGCFYKDNKLVALLPLYLEITNKTLVKEYRYLRFIGTGGSESEEVSTEYSDIICITGYEHDVFSFFNHYLETCGFDWHEFVLEKVLESSLILKSLSHPDCRIKYSKQCVGKRYYLDFTSGWEAYLEELPTKFRKKCDYYARRIKRSGRFSFSTTENAEQVDADLAILKDLHDKRWRTKGKKGAFQSEKFNRFHRNIMKLLISDNDLFLHKLDTDGEVIAALYAFKFLDTMHYYQSGYDHERFKQYSPGHVLIMKSIETAIANNCGRYDFMMGGFDSYKQNYGCISENLYDLKLFNSNGLSRLIRFVLSIKSSFRLLRKLAITKPNNNISTTS